MGNAEVGDECEAEEPSHLGAGAGDGSSEEDGSGEDAQKVGSEPEDFASKETLHQLSLCFGLLLTALFLYMRLTILWGHASGASNVADYGLLLPEVVLWTLCDAMSFLLVLTGSKGLGLVLAGASVANSITFFCVMAKQGQGPRVLVDAGVLALPMFVAQFAACKTMPSSGSFPQKGDLLLVLELLLAYAVGAAAAFSLERVAVAAPDARAHAEL
mmetsp:Transcript_26759/g.75152  ORF Transcript_26759/g.75152 Transcript_26759/m.75152 type:complete len:215 (-) Transcript_26759:97-741(-)|eukprot:CAMPEP_0176249098 /NCGR_PEP_ID=MMETSP0121_2-20121125/33803_1 /TAXON_ID=160619 /ORGANISM="Kryptoperidinium foliaceum, Strain CCMP 1326" /LENGTH=214 /DNA_ID=CAMNT_0017588789 /DNA_START=55 /DNA_END=699 /DNA_ORIENTATION=-